MSEKIKSINFNGFQKETFLFLRDLTDNNNKEWFQENKTRYQEQLVKPLKELMNCLEPYISLLNNELFTKFKTHVTTMAINKDMRFVKNTSPYRNYQKVSYPVNGRKWSNDPVLGFGIFPDFFYVASRCEGKSRKEYKDRMQRNFQKYPQVFERWLYDCKICENYRLIGGAHDDVKEISELPDRIVDWKNQKNLTVGKVWSSKNEDLYSQELIKFISKSIADLYFLKLWALSDNPEMEYENYLESREEVWKLVSLI